MLMWILVSVISFAFAQKNAKLHYHTITEGYTYTAAAIENVATYNGVADADLTIESARERIWVNMQQMEPLIVDAADQGADIVLLPEFGLTGLTHSRSVIRLLIEEIPDTDDNSIPCDESSEFIAEHPTITNLSCIAKENGVFLAVNYGDKFTCDIALDTCIDGWYQYNTQIVFDTAGQIVAKYWKLHTFEEPEYDTPEIDDPTDELYKDYVTFDLNGVKIGLITCYDSSYAYPLIPLLTQHGVYNFLISHWWVNDLPRMSALSWFQSLSRRYGVNLVVCAGTNAITVSGTTISGVAYFEQYVPSNSSGSAIIEQGYIRGEFFNSDDEEGAHLVIGTFEGLLPLDSQEVQLDWMGTIEHTQALPTAVGYDYALINTCLQPGAVITQTVVSAASDVSEEFSCTVEAKVSHLTGYTPQQCADWEYLLLDWAWLATSTGYFYPPDGGNIYYFEQYCTFYLCNRGSCQKTPILDGLDYIYYGNYGFANSEIKFEYIKITANFEPNIVKMSQASDGTGIPISPDYITYQDNYYSGDYSMTIMNEETEFLSATVLGRGYQKDLKYVEVDTIKVKDNTEINNIKSIKKVHNYHPFQLKTNNNAVINSIDSSKKITNTNSHMSNHHSISYYTYVVIAGLIMVITMLVVCKFKNYNSNEKYQELDENNPLLTQQL